MGSNCQGMQPNVTKFTINKEKIPIVWCKQWIQGSGQVCWRYRPSSYWGGIGILLKKSKRRHYSLQELNPKTKYPHPSAKRKLHEIPKKRQANQKTHGWPQGHPTVQFPKYMGRTEEKIQREKPMQKSPQRWEELKEFWIKKFHAEIGFRTNTIVNRHIAMVTLRVDVEIFKSGNIKNCFEKWANITQD